MKTGETTIPGCYLISLTAHRDLRGTFVKTFQRSAFLDLGLETEFTESFHSTSRQGVLRGMHFQMPPADGAKLVYALQGEVLDVALDLRVGSPAYGKAVTFRLNAETAVAAYIPRGVAHGFLVTAGPATLVYAVSAEYDPARDAGLLWDSFGLDWGVHSPVLSERDRSFPALEAFVSPFVFPAAEVKA